MIPNLSLLKERLAHHRENLQGWREPDGYLLPTEPDPLMREKIRAALTGAILELEHLLGGRAGETLVLASGPYRDRLRYGYEKTIHGSTAVNIERDPKSGSVVAVWFRCLPLPFTDHMSDAERVASMRRMYQDPSMQRLQLLGVDVERDL